jgi:hypothetical protein
MKTKAAAATPLFIKHCAWSASPSIPSVGCPLPLNYHHRRGTHGDEKTLEVSQSSNPNLMSLMRTLQSVGTIAIAQHTRRIEVVLRMYKLPNISYGMLTGGPHLLD